jgi:glycosyltransferase involved in cell wall biosynthesis
VGAALASVYAQTRRVNEVIVVNDCSPESDAIEAVLREYPQVVYIRNDRNLGLAASRNVGVNAATGEIVSFLDADDELHPQKIELQLNVFSPEIAVSCKVRRFGKGIGRERTVRYRKKPCVNEITSSQAIVLRNHLTGASIMISRALLLSLGSYDERLRSCEDFDLWLRLLDAGVKVRQIQLPLYLYRYNENGLSRNSVNVSFWELQVLQKYFQRHGRDFLASPVDSRIWAFWLAKHIFRYELSLNHTLRMETRRNIALLTAHPIMASMLVFIERARLFRPIGIFAGLYRKLFNT